MSRTRTTIIVSAGLAALLWVTGGFAMDAVVRDIDYIGGADYADGKDLLDVYMPEGAENVPVVVFFHGGALRFGTKDQGRLVAARLVPQGIGVVAANYRLSPAFQHPAHIEDAAAATAWVVRNIARYGGNPDDVYVAGHSAGGYLAALLALDDTHLGVHGLKLDAIKGSIPISPFLYVEETAKVRPKDVWGKDPADWLAASVTPHIGSGKPPLLLIYADGDDDWRKRQNETFGEAMRHAGSEATVEEVANRDHVTLITEITASDDRIQDLVVEFVTGP